MSPKIPHDAAPVDIPAARRERKDSEAAGLFRSTPDHEAIDALRRTDPAAFAALPPEIKISYGMYLDARDSASAFWDRA